MRETNRKIIEAVIIASGKSIVIESSKEPTRGLFLARHIPEAFLIHIIRHPEGVVSSYYERLKRRGWPMKFLRITFKPKGFVLVPALSLVAFSWVVGNILCELACKLSCKRCIRVRFEDFCKDPVGQIGRISHATGLSSDNVQNAIAKCDPLEIGHNMGGNHMRHSRQFLIDTNAPNRRTLPLVYRLITKVITFPWIIRYQYNILKNDISY